MKLQPAIEMAKIAEKNYEKFKQTILESEGFESLVNGIEETANEGCKTLIYNVDPLCDPRTKGFLKSLLIEAGYGVISLDQHAMQITW